MHRLRWSIPAWYMPRRASAREISGRRERDALFCDTRRSNAPRCQTTTSKQHTVAPLRPHPLVPAANVVPRTHLLRALLHACSVVTLRSFPVCIAFGHLVSPLDLLVHRIAHREPSRGRAPRCKTMATHSVRPVPIQNNRVEFRSTHGILSRRGYRH